jgi:hypothetical protein
MRVTLDLHDDLVSGILEAEVEAADAGEERHCLHAASGGRGSARERNAVRRVVVLLFRR